MEEAYGQDTGHLTERKIPMTQTWGPIPPPSAPSPQWGQAPPPKKRRNTGLILLVVIGGLLAVLAIAMLNGDPTSTTVEESASSSQGISKGLGTKDAAADVKLLSFRHRGYGEYQGTIEIVNHSDGTSDYYIELVILDQAGTNIDWTNAVAQQVRPGQRAVVHFSTFEKLAAKAQVTQIQRTSSS
jgi:hypothetical protein